MLVHFEADQLLRGRFLTIKVSDQRRAHVQGEYAEEVDSGRAHVRVCRRESLLCVRDYGPYVHAVNKKFENKLRGLYL